MSTSSPMIKQAAVRTGAPKTGVDLRNFSAGFGKEMAPGEGGVVAPPVTEAVMMGEDDIALLVRGEAKEGDFIMKAEIGCRLSCSSDGTNLRVVDSIYQSNGSVSI